MCLNQKISYLLIIKNDRLLLIFILSSLLLTPILYHNVYQVNNLVYAEETIMPILAYHNFTKGEGELWRG